MHDMNKSSSSNDNNNNSKIHKPLVNNILKLKPIWSALNTGTYKWASFLFLCYETLCLMNTL